MTLSIAPRTLVIVFVVTLVLSFNLASGQTQLNWVSVGPPFPPARCCPGMAYDRAHGKTVLFGGSTGAPPNLRDTWTFDGSSATWTQQFPSTAPSKRAGPGMAYDAATKTVVLFGGRNDTRQVQLRDTWIWDGTTWAKQFPKRSPPARSFDSGGMAYDNATGTVVLFGGSGGNGAAFGDTWVWDGVRKTWTQQFPPVSPPARFDHAMAYDVATRTVVVFGGFDSAGNPLGDTWAWDGNARSWTQQFPTAAPSPRVDANSAYDGRFGEIVLFGGFNCQSNCEFFADTWTWDGSTWKLRQPANSPPDRYAAGMAYDVSEKEIVMFGGFSSGPARNDTWLLTAP
jgi:hypothetical protein